MKTFFISISSIFILSVVSISEAYYQDYTKWLKCVPRRRFRYDHSWCQCNDDGTEFVCEIKWESTPHPELHINQLQNLSLPCIPNREFKNFGQDCVCDQTGNHASCLRYGKERIKETPDNCLPGSVFRNGCNGCICGPDGKAACTNLNCNLIYQGGDDKNIICVPNSQQVFECNHCDCTHDGTGMFCNEMGCSGMTFYHEHILNVTLSCRAKSTFHYNCHKCFCDKSGSYAICNGVACSNRLRIRIDQNTVDKCVPGLIFGDKCNVCICGRDGKEVCTTNSCDLTYSFKYSK